LIIKSSKILINSGRSREMMQKVQRFGSAMFVPVTRKNGANATISVLSLNVTGLLVA
jgi:hypothetical protein